MNQSKERSNTMSSKSIDASGGKYYTINKIIYCFEGSISSGEVKGKDMWWRKKKEKFDMEKFFEECQEQNPTPFTEEQRQMLWEYLENRSPEEIEMERRFLESQEWLNEKIANGEATIIETDRWRQIIVDGKVVRFEDSEPWSEDGL